jgi:hypothetical protein
MDTLQTGRQPRATTRGRWAPHHTLWLWLLLGWTVSAADRALTGRELPYRNIWAELEEEYGLNGNGACGEDAMD